MTVVIATHEDLFEAEDSRCDACGAVIAQGDDGEDGAAGCGGYLWSRGGQTEVEQAPLCPSCASTIGVIALSRWEADGDEG